MGFILALGSPKSQFTLPNYLHIAATYGLSMALCGVAPVNEDLISPNDGMPKREACNRPVQSSQAIACIPSSWYLASITPFLWKANGQKG
jgi:hypothetical protein